MSDLMREEFEKEWGQTNEEQGLRFVAELNLYGCDLYLNSGMADRKSSAWFYFQKGWQASRECLVIELPEPRVARGYGEQVADALGFNDGINYCEEAIHAAGVKTK